MYNLQSVLLLPNSLSVNVETINENKNTLEKNYK